MKTKEANTKPLKPIFSRHEDINKMAFMNWRMDGDEIRNLINIAEGFFDSALILADACHRTNKWKRADIIVFPIFSNANHGIELYLKAINWILNRLLNLPVKVEGSHNIDQIYRTVRSKVKTLGGKDELTNFNNATANLSLYIQELYSKTKAAPKDDKMDFARYPFNKKYDNHFYVDSWHSGRPAPPAEVDLANFLKRFKVIRNNLEIYSDYLFYVCLNGEDPKEYLLKYK
jgi:hypothetical protein